MFFVPNEINFLMSSCNFQVHYHLFYYLVIIILSLINCSILFIIIAAVRFNDLWQMLKFSRDQNATQVRNGCNCIFVFCSIISEYIYIYQLVYNLLDDLYFNYMQIIGLYTFFLEILINPLSPSTHNSDDVNI